MIISQSEQIKKLIEIQHELKTVIDHLQPNKQTLPAGAFAGLTTAEGELANALGKLDQRFCMSCQFGRHCGECVCCS